MLGGDTMLIKIKGYVTETNVKKGFKIRITDDSVKDDNGKYPNVSKEAEIIINPYHYPDNELSYVRVSNNNDNRRDRIDKCISVNEVLKKGDRVECSVYIVDDNVDANTDAYTINYDPIAILNYTRYNLWLYSNPDSFKRLEVDTRETLKYRKQNYYTDKNRNKCIKITGDSCQKYNRSWWINKNRIIVFPYFIGLWVKTKMSDLWSYLSAKNIVVLSIILTVALAFLGIAATFFVGFVFR